MTARRRSRGQALVEFALVAPVFFLLLFAIIEGGRFVFFYEVLNNATREGARYAIIHGDNAADHCPSGPMPGGATNTCDPYGDKVKAAVVNAAFRITNAGAFDTLDVIWPLTNGRGNPVTVRATFTYDPIMPLLPPIDITSESTLVINN
jgi:TadE-like protein